MKNIYIPDNLMQNLKNSKLLPSQNNRLLQYLKIGIRD